MQVDFYQLSRDPAESALAMIADKALETGERLLVVSADDAQLARISEALWSRKGSFLAHGAVGGPHEERQPILLSDRVEPANAARFVVFADGEWRDEGLKFERVFLLFDGSTIDQARATYRMLDGRDDVQRRYFKQEEGKWITAA
ncbi:MAG: DNA polymerase III subunit chi [Novosphingobium sp.]|uniref:DNA polymerase III subunit chi n=1 Tax=Novosphingobium sp. TaxID=1874826 RepID=UPI0032B736ED